MNRLSLSALTSVLLLTAACVGGPGAIGNDSGGGSPTGEDEGDGAGAPRDPAPPTSSDAGTSEPAAPLPSAGLYYVACLTQLASGDVDKVFSFRADVSFDGGTVDASIAALRLSPDGTPPETVATSEVVGGSASMSAPLSGTRFLGELGTLTIPAEANPISSSSVTIENATLEGKVSSAKFCARLGGSVTQPISLTLDATRNTCVFFPSSDGAARPTLQSSDFASCAL